jgi:alkylhydroperoxidase family enzyme
MGHVPYVVEDDLEPEYQDLITSSLQPGKRVNVYRAIGNNAAVLEGLRAFLGALWSESGVDAYRRELIILAISREYDSAYEWHQHVGVASEAGVTKDEIDAIADRDHEAFDEDVKRMFAYALAVARGEVDEEAHADIAELYDDSTVVGIAALAGGYAMLAQLIDALGVETESEFVGWNPRS